jgi:hypothetical protein
MSKHLETQRPPETKEKPFTSSLDAMVFPVVVYAYPLGISKKKIKVKL